MARSGLSSDKRPRAVARRSVGVIQSVDLPRQWMRPGQVSRDGTGKGPQRRDRPLPGEASSLSPSWAAALPLVFALESETRKGVGSETG
jgi:hypothetical protein